MHAHVHHTHGAIRQDTRSIYGLKAAYHRLKSFMRACVSVCVHEPPGPEIFCSTCTIKNMERFIVNMLAKSIEYVMRACLCYGFYRFI